MRSIQYKATTIVCEDYRDKQSGEHVDLTLNISFGCFATESEAKNVSATADDVKVELVNDVKTIVASNAKESSMSIGLWLQAFFRLGLLQRF